MPPAISSHVVSEDRYRPEPELDLRALIGMREPYSALRGLSAGTDEVQASLFAEPPLGRERGALAAAEAGRHLAILGSCALARINPVRQRHYYLPTDASLICLHPAAVAETSPLLGRGKAKLETKRRGRALCTLSSPNARPLFRLDVGYAVLTQRAFERLFADAPQATPSESGGHGFPLPLTGVVLQERRASFLLPRLEASMCAGHFEGYPLLPVASMMRTLSELAGALLEDMTATPNLTYVVERAEVEAHGFAKPREALLFEAEYRGRSAYGQYSFVCQASVPGGAPMGTLRLVLGDVQGANGSIR